MRRFLVTDLDASTLVLDPARSHHLTHVLRLSPGARVVLFDGRGREVVASVIDVQDGHARLARQGPVHTARPTQPMEIVVGLARGPAMDLAIRMGTEAGVTGFWPFVAARSVAKGDRADRWLRIATEAARQCGRADVPEIAPVQTLGAVLEALPVTLDRRVAVPGGPRLPASAAGVAVFVGPEGGLTPSEVGACLAGGAQPVGLGRWTLRVATAVVAAAVLSISDD